MPSVDAVDTSEEIVVTATAGWSKGGSREEPPLVSSAADGLFAGVDDHVVEAGRGRCVVDVVAAFDALEARLVLGREGRHVVGELLGEAIAQRGADHPRAVRDHSR